MTTAYKVTASNKTMSISGNEYKNPIDALRDCLNRVGKKRPTRWSITKGRHETRGNMVFFTFMMFEDPILRANTHQELSDLIRMTPAFAEDISNG